MRIPRALVLRPTLELRRITDIEAIQEWARVQTNSTFALAGGERLVELPQVDLDQGGVKPQVVGGGQEDVAAEIMANGVEHLRERMTRTLGIAFWPEVGDCF